MPKTKLKEVPKDTITVTLAELINCAQPNPQNPTPALTTLSTSRMPGKQSYYLGRLIKDVMKELEAFDPVRLSLCAKYGTLSEGKQEYVFTFANRKKFDEEYKETTSAEIVLFHKKMPELLDIVQLTPAEAIALEWLVGE